MGIISARVKGAGLNDDGVHVEPMPSQARFEKQENEAPLATLALQPCPGNTDLSDRFTKDVTKCLLEVLRGFKGLLSPGEWLETVIDGGTLALRNNQVLLERGAPVAALM